eukprot:SAG31_NODE_4375_length_3294_cov_2.255399_2_plen_75_part_00
MNYGYMYIPRTAAARARARVQGVWRKVARQFFKILNLWDLAFLQSEKAHNYNATIIGLSQRASSTVLLCTSTST